MHSGNLEGSYKRVFVVVSSLAVANLLTALQYKKTVRSVPDDSPYLGLWNFYSFVCHLGKPGLSGTDVHTSCFARRNIKLTVFCVIMCDVLSNVAFARRHSGERAHLESY